MTCPTPVGGFFGRGSSLKSNGYSSELKQEHTWSAQRLSTSDPSPNHITNRNEQPLVVISSQGQLSDDGKKMCDDLIEEILNRDYPFPRELTVDDVRSEFWNLVFADGWTTWFDEQGTAVSDDEVKLPNDMSLDYVRGQAMQLCDCYEIQMVNKLNRSIIAHWGRNRLLALARGPWTEHAASCKEEKLNLLLCPRLSRWVVQESISDHKFLINQGIVIGDMYTELSNSELYPPDDQPYERGEIDLDLVLIPGLVGALNLLKPLSETEHPNLGGHWY
ncbi:hypothetical protein CPLU01_11954 [Colletotrichum plurivorum]|uniref:Uncharacterized protein n=1 Tax=Colletotrichum plurivorum TaxID=2175906 RepID=A0A8H6K141_9PEZI|nr:hypothetical protein CPLU01_11954 [Colletotrichum plurivorum]